MAGPPCIQTELLGMAMVRVRTSVCKNVHNFAAGRSRGRGPAEPGALHCIQTVVLTYSMVRVRTSV